MLLSQKKMEAIADAFEAAAGATTTTSPNDMGRWARIAAAAETLRGIASTANHNRAGLMYRTVIALEALSGTNGAAENRNEEGLLKRIYDALAVLASATSAKAGYAGKIYDLAATAAIAGITIDKTPAAFSFTDVTNAVVNTVQTSDAITVSAMRANTAAAVSITGGTYSKNGGAYTSAPGKASNTDTFTVRHTSSAIAATAVNTVLTIGGVSDTFTSTTAA
jgi:hypothetical protein